MMALVYIPVKYLLDWQFNFSGEILFLLCLSLLHKGTVCMYYYGTSRGLILGPNMI